MDHLSSQVHSEHAALVHSILLNIICGWDHIVPKDVSLMEIFKKRVIISKDTVFSLS